MRPHNNKLLGKVLSLTREIRLRKPADQEGFLHQFIVGGTKGSPNTSALIMSWYVTRKGYRISEDLAQMAISTTEGLQDGDIASFSPTILDAFQVLVADGSLFQFGKLMQMNWESLFELRAIPHEMEFAQALWGRIGNDLENSLDTWLFLYPLPRVNPVTFFLENEKVFIASISDPEIWDHFGKMGYWDPGEWDPVTCQFRGRTITGTDLKWPSTWLVSQVSGTHSLAIKRASQLLGQFIAIVFSYLQRDKPWITRWSMADPERIIIQFPMSGSHMFEGPSISSVREICFPFAETIEFPAEVLDWVSGWYKTASNLPQESRNRMRVSAQFIHRALITNDEERFLNFHYALDALFGIRGKTETSILDGIAWTLANPNMQAKFKKLYDLRCELVHGGCFGIDSWRKYQAYRKHFDSNPKLDIQQIAMECLCSFVEKTPPRIMVQPRSWADRLLGLFKMQIFNRHHN